MWSYTSFCSSRWILICSCFLFGFISAVLTAPTSTLNDEAYVVTNDKYAMVTLIIGGSGSGQWLNGTGEWKGIVHKMLQAHMQKLDLLDTSSLKVSEITEYVIAFNETEAGVAFTVRHPLYAGNATVSLRDEFVVAAVQANSDIISSKTNFSLVSVSRGPIFLPGYSHWGEYFNKIYYNISYPYFRVKHDKYAMATLLISGSGSGQWLDKTEEWKVVVYNMLSAYMEKVDPEDLPFFNVSAIVKYIVSFNETVAGVAFTVHHPRFSNESKTFFSDEFVVAAIQENSNLISSQTNFSFVSVSLGPIYIPGYCHWCEYFNRLYYNISFTYPREKNEKYSMVTMVISGNGSDLWVDQPGEFEQVVFEMLSIYMEKLDPKDRPVLNVSDIKQSYKASNDTETGVAFLVHHPRYDDKRVWFADYFVVAAVRENSNLLNSRTKFSFVSVSDGIIVLPGYSKQAEHWNEVYYSGYITKTTPPPPTTPTSPTTPTTPTTPTPPTTPPSPTTPTAISDSAVKLIGSSYVLLFLLIPVVLQFN